MAISFPVLGARQSGKTYLIRKLASYLSQKTELKPAGAIPFEIGISSKNAKDTLTDAEKFSQDAGGTPLCLHSLYQGYQNFPITFCAETEGFKLKLPFFESWLESAMANHSPVFLEYAGGLLNPLFGDICFLDLMQKWKTPYLLVADGSAEGFEKSLYAMRLLKDSGLSGFIVLNDSQNSKDVPWFQYIHEAVAPMNCQTIGALPYLPEDDPTSPLLSEVLNSIAVSLEIMPNAL